MGIIISCSVAIMIIIACFIWAYFEEKKAFNDGKCPRCGRPLMQITEDSQGGKLYKCPKCKYKVWVSYFN